jgi:hypothetical protein
MSPEQLLIILKETLSKIQKVSYDHILQYFDYLDLSHLLGLRIPEEFSIYRARVAGAEEFNTAQQISYNRNPLKFGRANRPGFPLFYGAIGTQQNEEPLVTNFAELLEISPYLSTEGKIDLVVGRWDIKEELYAILMIFNPEYLSKISHFHKLYKEYFNKVINKSPQNYRSYKVLEFVASEYAKPSYNDDNNYKISAAFFEKVLERSIYEIDSIIYPSVKCEGKYFNIALTPKAVDNYLNLTKVAKIRLYFKNSYVINDYLMMCDVESGTDHFSLQPITDPEYHRGEKKCLEIMNKLSS